MQPTSGGGGCGGVGGGDITARGLARFRSAPATWLDALLESVAEDDDLLLKPPIPAPPQQHHLPPTPPLRSDADLFDGAASASGLFRQNSSPAEFVSSGSDSYFSSYQVIGAGGSYDFTPSTSSSRKRPRDDLDKFSSQLKEEDQGEHLERGLSGLLDPEMEKLLEDSVPCRVRAKRGCATHPRSIAERVRRTRISDRIRKLQELVPNMEKQTNTADMLAEAVEYVKFLQKQIQELTEQQKNCKCVHK